MEARGDVRAPHGARRGRPRLRIVVGLAAASAALPYVVLKLAWIAGSTVGMADPSVFDNATYRVANTLTLIADALAIALALALTYPWGERVPAWLVLFPMWIATGLLGTIVVLVLALPLTLGAADHGGDSGGGAPDALRPWVFALVYGGFAVQGALILIAFFHYARRRWPALYTPRRDGLAPTGTRGRSVSTGLGVSLAIVTGLINLAWAAGTTIGLGGLSAGQTAARRPMFGVLGVFALVAVVGVMALRRRRRRGGPLWLPAALTLAGTGSLFAWGLYMLAVTAAGGPGTPALNIVNALRAAAAVLLLGGMCPRAGTPWRPS